MDNLNTTLLGDLLVESELITPEQLSNILEKQKATKNKLGDILVSEGYVAQEDIIRMLEFKLGVPSIKIEEYGVEQEASTLIPESTARKYELIPLKKEKNILVVAMSDPLNVYAIDDVRIITGMEVQPVIATSGDISRAISRYYGTQKAIKALQEYIRDKEITAGAGKAGTAGAQSDESLSSAPIVRIINSILEQAVRNNASDIHIEPFENNVKVRYRIDGQLKEIMKIDLQVLQSLLTRIKIMGNMNISEKRTPQDGRIGIVIDGKTYDLRVSVIPIVYGEKIVMRVIDKSSFLIPKEKLGFGESEITIFKRLIENPYGIILVTGPTGSGKSTTLYSAIQELNVEGVNIVTIEDPIESVIEGIGQIQVNPKIGLTFAAGLRSILRQDPDIIMIGEIRDAETAQIAIRSAITGHLVLSTLHTNDAPSTITRLIDMGIEPFLTASSIAGIIAQRLARKICGNCKIRYKPENEELKQLGPEARDIEFLHRGKGCPVCLGTGYKGRIGVFEILEMTKKHREMINHGANEDDIREYSISLGMKTIRDSAARLVISGVTTLSELKRITYANE